MIDAVEMSYLEALSRATDKDHKGIALARKYHDGDQTVYLTERVQEFLGLHAENTFRLNVCRTVVTAVTDELAVIGFDASEKGTNKPLAQWAQEVWDANHMETVQDEVHEAALRDRETFVIVDWDADKKVPVLIQHNRYTSLESGGDGQGVWMLYENDDPNQPAICAVQQWIETIFLNNGNTTSRIRRTIYYPDRIERWVYSAGWIHYEEEGKPWPTPWVRGTGKNRKPIGIPVLHFRNKGMRPEAWDAIPMQDAINKTLIDVLGTADVAAFPILVALGFIPTTDGQALKTDGSNAMKIEPMRILGTTKSKSEAELKKIEGEDPTKMMEALKDLILLTAMVTGTPASRFNTTKQIAGQDTLKEQEKPLQKKAADRRASFGETWAQCMSMARTLANLFGRAGLDESRAFKTVWKHSESLDELEKKQVFGIPQETIWSEMGYTAEQIEAMKQSTEYKYRLEKMLWEAVAAAGDMVPVEMILRRLGFDDAALAQMGTMKLAAIKVAQEDVIPPMGQ